MNNKNVKIVTILVVAVMVILLGGNLIKSLMRDKKITNARNTYQKFLTDIEDYRDTDDIINSVSIDTEFYDDGDGTYYRQVDWCKIIVYVSDEVETLSAEDKCNLLHIYQNDIEKQIKDARKSSGYQQIIDENKTSSGYVKYKGRYAIVQNDYDIDFVSSHYEYAFYPNHFYVTKPNLGGSVEYSYKFEENKLVYFKDTKTEKEEKAPQLPYVGMREEYLRYTSLGTPDSVEKCMDFDKLQTRARYKTYEWEATSEHGWYKITVRYRKHNSHQVDDYEDLPTSNGYVSDITYTDENGIVQRKSYVDTY